MDGGLFAAEVAATRERVSTAEIQAKFARGLMTYLEVFEAALRASYARPDIRAELTRQFRSSPDDLIRGVGDDLAEYTRREAALRSEAQPNAAPDPAA